MNFLWHACHPLKAERNLHDEGMFSLSSSSFEDDDEKRTLFLRADAVDGFLILLFVYNQDI